MNSIVKSFYNWYSSQVKHPIYRWIIILGTLLYFVTPYDLCPDFLPILGWIDDGIILSILGAELSRLILSHRSHNNSPNTSLAKEKIINITGEAQI